MVLVENTKESLKFRLEQFLKQLVNFWKKTKGEINDVKDVVDLSSDPKQIVQKVDKIAKLRVV